MPVSPSPILLEAARVPFLSNRVLSVFVTLGAQASGRRSPHQHPASVPFLPNDRCPGRGGDQLPHVCQWIIKAGELDVATTSHSPPPRIRQSYLDSKIESGEVRDVSKTPREVFANWGRHAHDPLAHLEATMPIKPVSGRLAGRAIERGRPRSGQPSSGEKESTPLRRRLFRRRLIRPTAATHCAPQDNDTASRPSCHFARAIAADARAASGRKLLVRGKLPRRLICYPASGDKIQRRQLPSRRILSASLAVCIDSCAR